MTRPTNLIKIDDLCDTFMWDSGDPVKWGELIIANVKNPKNVTLIFPNITQRKRALMLSAKFASRVKHVQIGLYEIPEPKPLVDKVDNGSR